MQSSELSIFDSNFPRVHSSTSIDFGKFSCTDSVRRRACVSRRAELAGEARGRTRSSNRRQVMFFVVRRPLGSVVRPEPVLEREHEVGISWTGHRSNIGVILAQGLYPCFRQPCKM